MAGSFTNFLSAEILDHVFGAATYTPPATIYVGLFTVVPSDASGGTEVTTGNWTNYARQAITNSISGSTWVAATVADPSLKTNAAAVSFGVAVIPGSAQTIVGMGLFDALTTGNLLAWSDQSPSKVVSNGDTPSFAAGEIDLSLD